MGVLIFTEVNTLYDTKRRKTIVVIGYVCTLFHQCVRSPNKKQRQQKIMIKSCTDNSITG